MKCLVLKYWLLLSLALPVYCHAQNVKEDFRKIKAAHESEAIAMDFVYQVYRSGADQAPLGTENGRLIKSGNRSYLKIGDMETIRNSSYSLMVDHDEQLISLLPAEKSIGNTSKLFEMDFDKMLALCKKIEFVQGTTQHQYILSLPEGSEFSMFRLSYNSKTYLVEKLEMFYRASMNLSENQKARPMPPKVTIIYKNIDRHPRIDPSIFSYSPYLKKEREKLVLREPYKKFELVNLLKAGL